MKKTVEQIIERMKYRSSSGYMTILDEYECKSILSELSRLQSENDELLKRLTNK